MLNCKLQLIKIMCNNIREHTHTHTNTIIICIMLLYVLINSEFTIKKNINYYTLKQYNN